LVFEKNANFFAENCEHNIDSLLHQNKPMDPALPPFKPFKMSTVLVAEDAPTRPLEMTFPNLVSTLEDVDALRSILRVSFGRNLRTKTK
jgi:hypothetical protein